jgi:hypothetical protein
MALGTVPGDPDSALGMVLGDLINQLAKENAVWETT